MEQKIAIFGATVNGDGIFTRKSGIMNLKNGISQDKGKRSFKTIFLENLESTFLGIILFFAFALVAFTPMLFLEFGFIQDSFWKAFAIAWTLGWFVVGIVAFISWTVYEGQDEPERPNNYYY